MLCVGTDGPSKAERKVVYGVLAFVLLAGAAPAVYFIAKGPPWEQDEATPPAAKKTSGPAKDPRPPRKRSWADKVAADPGTAPPEPPPRLEPEPKVTPLNRHRPRRTPRRRSAAVEIRDIPPKVQVTVYVAPWCGYCRKARRWLRRMKIRHQTIDIERSAAGKRALRAINPRGSIPTFVVNGRVIVGFNPGAVLYAIRSARSK